MTTAQNEEWDPSTRYEIFYDDTACKDLDVLSEKDYQRIDQKIVDLGGAPRPPGNEKLHDSIFRVRQGPWRIIYVVDDAMKRVIVSRVKRRNESTYKDV